jgi:hypothetical protein
MYAILVAAGQFLVATIVGPLLIRVIMFLGLNIATQFVLAELTGMSASVLNPFNIGPLINGLLANIVWPEVLWGMSFFNLATILALYLNAMLVAFAFRLMVSLVR